jgi:hypothetical protein
MPNWIRSVVCIHSDSDTEVWRATKLNAENEQLIPQDAEDFELLQTKDSHVIYTFMTPWSAPHEWTETMRKKLETGVKIDCISYLQ